MKKKLKWIASISLVFILFLVSCKKDQNEIIVTESSANIDGFVSDELGQPVKNATVAIGSKNVVTNEKGYFNLRDGKYSSHVFITIDKTGYFQGSRSVFPFKTKDHHVRIQLIKKEFNGANAESFNASIGGKVIYQSVTNPIQSKIELNFPASSIVDANGNDYVGIVKVALHYIDPSSYNQRSTMPGDLVAIDQSGQQRFLGSYGMAAIELQGSTGQKLNVKSGKQVELKLLIPNALQSTAPASIPLWYFDEKTGLWKEEGSATKTGNYYIGNVSHFSFWNCDAPFPLVNLRGKLVHNDVPVTNASVRIKIASTGNSGYGRTNQEGVFEGKVPKNENLTLEVLDECGSVIYTQNLGSLTSNTDLGTISIPASTAQIITINGMVTDCANVPLADAVILLKTGTTDISFKSNSAGQYTGKIIVCNAGGITATVIAYNLTTLKQSQTVTITGSGLITVPNLQVCNDPISADEFITLQTSTGINTIFLSNLFIRATTPGSNSGFGSEDSLQYISVGSQLLSLNVPVNITYISGKLSNNTYFAAQGSGGTISAGTGSVTATQIANSVGEYYEGSYYYNNINLIQNNITTPNVNLTGTFRIKRK